MRGKSLGLFCVVKSSPGMLTFISIVENTDAISSQALSDLVNHNSHSQLEEHQ